MMFPLAATFPVKTKLLHLLLVEQKLELPPEPALNHTLSPIFASVTVVEPTVNGLQSLALVEYSNVTAGAPV